MPSLRDDIRRIVREELARCAVVGRRGPVQSAEAKGGLLYTTIAGYPGANADEQIRGALCEPYGHASRPPADTNLVAVRIGGDWVHLGAEDRSHRPGLEEGEVALYNAHGAKLVLLADGTGTWNDGAAKVARVGDSVSGTITDSFGGECTITTLTISDNDATLKA